MAELIMFFIIIFIISVYEELTSDRFKACKTITKVRCKFSNFNQ